MKRKRLKKVKEKEDYIKEEEEVDERVDKQGREGLGDERKEG